VSWPIIITLLFGSLLVLMALGVPVGLGFLGVTTVTAYKVGQFAANVLPMVSIIAAVVLLMMMGVATAAESAAYGAAAVFVLYAVYELAVPLLRLIILRDVKARREARARITAFAAVSPQGDAAVARRFRITVLSLLIIFGSALYGNVMAASGASDHLVRWVLSLDTSPLALLGMMLFILLFLGASWTSWR
jgi:TRAP-type C4-dicarboxylate transport system permease large subunit